MGEWLYCNFAAGSFYTKKHCSRLYSIEIELYLKQKQKIVFEAPFGGFRGSVCTPFIARWKACGRLPIYRKKCLRDIYETLLDGLKEGRPSVLSLFYTVSQIHDTDVAHFDTDQPVLVISGGDVAERLCYQMVVCCPTSPN